MTRRLRHLAALGLMPLAACYTRLPVDTATRPLTAGDLVTLDVTDAGRVQLAERFGAGVVQIEGRLRGVTDTRLEVLVSRVTYLREGDSQWAGEPVTLDRAVVGRVYERRLNKGRTALAAGVVGGGLVAFIITRGLIGSGRERDPVDEPPGPITARLPRFQLIH